MFQLWVAAVIQRGHSVKSWQ